MKLEIQRSNKVDCFVISFGPYDNEVYFEYNNGILVQTSPITKQKKKFPSVWISEWPETIKNSWTKFIIELIIEDINTVETFMSEEEQMKYLLGN